MLPTHPAPPPRLPPARRQDPRHLRLHGPAERAQAPDQALAAGDWLETSANLLAIGNSGAGKTHLLCAIGHALVEAGYRVLYTRTTELVQKLQAARRDLALESALAKLDKFGLLILDDIAYAQKDQAETSVLFELIARRYETRSLAIAANQPFSAWDRIFPDKAVTVAAIDRLVHHATILEMNVDSYRRRAVARRHGEAVAPPSASADSLADNQEGADEPTKPQPQQPADRPTWLSVPDKEVDALQPRRRGRKLIRMPEGGRQRCQSRAETRP